MLDFPFKPSGFYSSLSSFYISDTILASNLPKKASVSIILYDGDKVLMSRTVQPEPIAGSDPDNSSVLLRSLINADTAAGLPYSFRYEFIAGRDVLASGGFSRAYGGDPATDINTIKRGA